MWRSKSKKHEAIACFAAGCLGVAHIFSQSPQAEATNWPTALPLPHNNVCEKEEKKMI